jgi:hypothetical protein
MENNQKYLFIIAYARFDYALKKAKFLRSKKENRPALADWFLFQKKLHVFRFEKASEEVQAAVTYLSSAESMPKSEMVMDECPMFVPRAYEGKKDIDKALEGVRRVRAALFHGGEFDGQEATAQRNEKLITSSLIVLKQCLEEARFSSDHKFKETYESFLDMGEIPGSEFEAKMLADWLKK